MDLARRRQRHRRGRRLSVGLGIATALLIAAPATTLAQETDLPDEKLTMKSILSVDLENGIATLPLHAGTANGEKVWYVITDVSDADMAAELGVNHAPRLANAGMGCPACVASVTTSGDVLGAAPVEFPGTIDFSPGRVLTPGPEGFPPVAAVPGAQAKPGYSDLVRIGDGTVVFNAPIIATGEGPFDVLTHKDTNDRVMAMDTDAMTVDLQFIRAFSHGKEIFYLTFGSSGALGAVLERGTFVPVLGTLPFGNDGDNPKGARSAIFTFTNGQRGDVSPPAQGMQHVILDAGQEKDLNVEAEDVLAALERGGDAHNVLDSFPTLSGGLAELYTPMWDLHVGVWSPEVVAAGENVAQTDANQIRQLAAQKLVTNPGGGPLGSANFVVNCPVIGFADSAPDKPQAPAPPGDPDTDDLVKAGLMTGALTGAAPGDAAQPDNPTGADRGDAPRAPETSTDGAGVEYTGSLQLWVLLGAAFGGSLVVQLLRRRRSA